MQATTRQKHSHCWPANYCCIVDLFPSAAPCCNVGTQKRSRINAAFCFAFCSSCRSLRAINCRAKHWIFVAWAVCQGRAVSRMQSPKLVCMLIAGRLQLLFLSLPACKIHWAVTPACLPYSSSTSCAWAHERFCYWPRRMGEGLPRIFEPPGVSIVVCFLAASFASLWRDYFWEFGFWLCCVSLLAASVSERVDEREILQGQWTLRGLFGRHHHSFVSHSVSMLAATLSSSQSCRSTKNGQLLPSYEAEARVCSEAWLASVEMSARCPRSLNVCDGWMVGEACQKYFCSKWRLDSFLPII